MHDIKRQFSCKLHRRPPRDLSVSVWLLEEVDIFKREI